jgi:hypothetical protein
MFVGHFALGFGAKKVAPMVSLGTLFLAAQFADVLWPTLLMPRATRARTKAGDVLRRALRSTPAEPERSDAVRPVDVAAGRLGLLVG